MNNNIWVFSQEKKEEVQQRRKEEWIRYEEQQKREEKQRSLNDKLVTAAKNKDLDTVRLCLNNGANVNSYIDENKKLWFVVDYAVYNNDQEILNVLLEKNVGIRPTSILHAIKNRNWSIAKLLIDASKYIDSTILIEAVYEGHYDTVKLLISKGVKVNYGIKKHKKEELSSPLIIAMEMQHPEIAELLLHSGADINKTHVTSPLIWATKKKYLNWVKFLLSKGADVNLIIQKETALMCAVQRGYTDIVTCLVEMGANLQQSNEKPLLMEAAEKGFLPIVKCLISKGADKNEYTSNGETALICAIKNHQFEVAKYLLSLRNVHVNKAVRWGESPLAALNEHVSDQQKNNIGKLLIDAGAVIESDFFTKIIEEEQIEMIKFLVDRGVNVNKPNKNGDTPLACALKTKNIGIIKFLLENGAHFSVHSNFMSSIEPGDLEIVKLLLSHGANVNMIDKNTGETPLIKATKLGLTEIVQELLKHKTDVNLKSSLGIVPLIFAIELREIDVSKLIIRHGADVNATSIIGETPLLQAIKLGLAEIVQELLKRNVDVNKKSKQGAVPLIEAIEFKMDDIALLLIQNGADPKSTDSNGNSALMKAIEHGQVEIARVLMEKGAVDTLPHETKTELLTAALDFQKESIINPLLEKNATITDTSLLMHYVEHSNTKAIDLLLHKGVNLDDIRDNGFTPLTRSIQRDSYKMVKFLVTRGASVNKADENGNSPLSLAASNLNFQIFEFLLRSGADVNRDLAKLREVAAADQNFEVYLQLVLTQRNTGQGGNLRHDEIFLGNGGNESEENGEFGVYVMGGSNQE